MRNSTSILVALFGTIALTSTACSEPTTQTSPNSTKVEVESHTSSAVPDEKSAEDVKVKEKTVTVKPDITEAKEVMKIAPRKAKSSLPVKTTEVISVPVKVKSPKVVESPNVIAPVKAAVVEQPKPSRVTEPQPVKVESIIAVPPIVKVVEAEPIQVPDVDARPPVKHLIEITKMKFSKPKLDVRVGDEVTWTNLDIVPHTATANDKSWDSGRLKKGESFTMIITDETSLAYFCLYHRQMKAEFVIQADS